VSYLDGIDESERIAAEFWAESGRRKQLEEEAATAATPLEYFTAAMRLAWTADNLVAIIRGEAIRFGPQDLDEWLAEDNPHRLTHYGVPGVLEALGL
jgi:hypothetical protein